MPDRRKNEPTIGPITPKGRVIDTMGQVQNAIQDFPPVKILNSPLGQALLAMLPMLPGGKGDAMLRNHELPGLERPAMPAEFTPVGGEPPSPPPARKAPGGLDAAYERMMKGGGKRTTPERRKPVGQ